MNPAPSLLPISRRTKIGMKWSRGLAKSCQSPRNLAAQSLFAPPLLFLHPSTGNLRLITHQLNSVPRTFPDLNRDHTLVKFRPRKLQIFASTQLSAIRKEESILGKGIPTLSRK